MIKSLGVDLAGSEKRPTGICLMRNDLRIKTWIVYSDEEIIRIALSTLPDVIAIDAPLTIPKGRRSIEDRAGPHLRECDKELLRMRIRFFPITLGPMRLLTKRGIALRKKLERLGFMVIEVYPGGAQDVLGIPRKSKGLDRLRKGLEKLGIKGLNECMTGDELDAVTAAYVGLLYLKGEAVKLGGEDGIIIMPKPHPTQKDL